MKNFRLTEDMLIILKEALTCAEVQRDLTEKGSGKKFEALHDIIDNQIFEQNEYAKIVLNKVNFLFL